MPSVELPQGRIHLIEDGSGPPVVLLHGVFVSARLWRKVVPLLAAEHRVIAPHLPLGAHPEPLRPGADRSPAGVARLVADLLEALDLDDVTLVGNDTGGAIAQLVAADHPERIGRLVLTSCDLLEQFPPRFFKPLVEAAKLPGVLALLGFATRSRAIRESPLAFGWLAKRPIDDDVIRAWLAPGRRPEIRRDVKKVLVSIEPEITQRAAEGLRSFDRPVLVAWAADDKVMPVEHAHRLAALVPDGRVELIEDSYTFTPEDRPEALAALVAGFVRERLAAPAPVETS